MDRNIVVFNQRNKFLQRFLLFVFVKG